MGSKRAEQFKQVTDTVAKTVKSASGVVIAALVLAAAAAAIAVTALIVATRMRAAHG